MDIKPIMGQYGYAGYLRKINVIDEIVLPENAIQKRRKRIYFAHVEENGRETELIIGPIKPLTSNHFMILKQKKKDRD